MKPIPILGAALLAIAALPPLSAQSVEPPRVQPLPSSAGNTVADPFVEPAPSTRSDDPFAKQGRNANFGDPFRKFAGIRPGQGPAPDPFQPSDASENPLWPH